MSGRCKNGWPVQGRVVGVMSWCEEGWSVREEVVSARMSGRWEDGWSMRRYSGHDATRISCVNKTLSY